MGRATRLAFPTSRAPGFWMLPLNTLLLLDAGLFGGLIGTDVGNLEFFVFFFFGLGGQNSNAYRGQTTNVKGESGSGIRNCG